MIAAESHYVAFAAAYARGCLRIDVDDDTAIARGVEAGLKLHRFKRSAMLPRVRAVIGALRGFAATSIADLGSGRGAFVWPLLDALPIELVATDMLDYRAKLFADVRRGGIDRVHGVRADATALPFADASTDVVTALEVLEHMPGDGPARAAAEAMRVARTAVIATVPSQADDNPEHVHLFTRDTLAALFAGARKVSIDYVLGHIVCVATK